jgi:DNA-binding transcriptional ArsR family regulator
MSRPRQSARPPRSPAVQGESTRRTTTRAAIGTGPNAARVFAALGDDTRLALVASLCANGAVSIARLTAGTDMSRQGVTKHLRILADAGLASAIRDGRERLWQFEPAPLREAQHRLELIEQQWDRARFRLEHLIENAEPRSRGR